MTFVLFPVQIRNWRAFNDGGAKFIAAYDSDSHAFSPSLIASAKAGEILFNGGLLFVRIRFMSCFLSRVFVRKIHACMQSRSRRVEGGAVWPCVCGLL